ncbi:hypothetical protein [uncultured Gilvimarinus sp.]|uniref:hypothetical protein n=1 Tax=uncultured Gilvimarinus sp. TaxID=1689143 RepID=UPI0030EDB5C1
MIQRKDSFVLGADLSLAVNDETVAQGSMDATVPARFGVDTFGIGEDTGQPVSVAYKPPFAFTGEIEKVTVDIK